MVAEELRVGDRVKILGKGIYRGSEGVITAINPNNTFPIAVSIGLKLVYFARAEVVKL